MRHKDLVDLRKKEIKDLIALVAEKKQALMKAMAEAKLGSEKNVKLPWQLRREIAKISTIIREKELSAMIEAEEKQMEADSK
jgi:ribosomal protein L29